MLHLFKDLQEEHVIIGDINQEENRFNFHVVNVGEVVVIENMNSATVITPTTKVTMEKIETFDFLCALKEEVNDYVITEIKEESIFFNKQI